MVEIHPEKRLIGYARLDRGAERRLRMLTPGAVRPTTCDLRIQSAEEIRISRIVAPSFSRKFVRLSAGGSRMRTVGPAETKAAFGYSLLIMKSLSAADSAPQTSPLRPASCRTLA
jgi:hypothetical protein